MSMLNGDLNLYSHLYGAKSLAIYPNGLLIVEILLLNHKNLIYLNRVEHLFPINLILANRFP